MEVKFLADVEFHNEETFQVTFQDQEEFKLKWTYADAKSADEYMGQYEVTPSEETQTLETKDTKLTRNVTINPIPQNYGLITCNGSVLTFS